MANEATATGWVQYLLELERHLELELQYLAELKYVELEQQRRALGL